MLEQLGIPHREVKLPKHLQGLEGLILPGGESTTMLKMLAAFDMFEPLQAFAETGLPVLGTCAGAILMMKTVNFQGQKSLGWIPGSIDRNAYGSQRESFSTQFDCPLWGIRNVEALYIRAPRFQDLGQGVQVLATLENHITGIVYHQFTAVTFHPELTDDTRFHQAWLERFVLRRELAS